MKKTICIILATTFAATLQAAVPLAWNVETTRAQPAAFDCYRGETLDLRASLYNAGTALDVSGAAANLYWQTNGMGEVYWSAPATAASNVLSATWAPTNDVGATSYNCFIGKPGEIYRAAFRLRMLPSPGAVPSELDLPAKSIDFATVTVLNAPYYTQGEVDSAIAFEAGAATNYADSVAQSAINYTDSTAASLRDSISAKQDTISDLAAIRSGAALGATALQSYTETDPTVPAWAKAASKPAYTYSEITGKPTFATVATSGSYNDLTDKPTIPSPTAPVASATLAWQSNGSAIVVSVGADGTLSATLTDWIEGQTQTALITLAAGASVSSEVKLVGYGTWPTGGQFLASATRVGNNVYVTPIVLVN